MDFTGKLCYFLDSSNSLTLHNAFHRQKCQNENKEQEENPLDLNKTHDVCGLIPLDVFQKLFDLFQRAR